MDFKKHIRTVPDFPKPGILFYDISTLLANAAAWKALIDHMAHVTNDYKPDILAGIESRGFLVAAPLALKLGLGFIMIRKKGKLPGSTISYTYDLEYGADTIEIQKNDIKKNQRVLILDDLLATGGTLIAATNLLRKANAEVIAASCIIELTFLNGRKKLDIPIRSLIQYDK